MTLKKPKYSSVARKEKKLLGIADDEFLLKFIAQFVKLIQIDEVKTDTISLSEIIKK